MPIIACINLKGGVAKTTNCVALAEACAVAGHRTLLIDADHQCMASECLMGEEALLSADEGNATLYDLIREGSDPKRKVLNFAHYVHATDPPHTPHSPHTPHAGYERLAVMPCSIRMDELQTNLAKARRGFMSSNEFQRRIGRCRRELRRWLKKRYDVVLIDCPPSLADQVRFLMRVVDAYLVPCVPDRLSVRGIMALQDRMRRRNYKVPAVGLLWSLFRKQNPTHCQYIEESTQGVPPFDALPRPLASVIPNATRIASAFEEETRRLPFRQKFTPQFADLYSAAATELLERCQRLESELPVKTEPRVEEPV